MKSGRPIFVLPSFAPTLLGILPLRPFPSLDLRSLGRLARLDPLPFRRAVPLFRLLLLPLLRPHLLAFLPGLPFLLLDAGPAGATPAVENYPRIALYTSWIDQMTPAEIDSVTWFDRVYSRVRPESLQELRGRRGDIELYYPWLPQTILDTGGTWWYPDTTWSLTRLVQFYGERNDWFLKDTSGERIPEWSGYAANWTRYCPAGAYGTSVGLNYVQWLKDVALRQILENPEGPPWHPGSDSFDGLMLEVIVDCPGSFSTTAYAFADPDADGEPEGVGHVCSLGGDEDSLSILYREMNDTLRVEIARLQAAGVPILANIGNERMGPHWFEEFTGYKLEGAFSRNNPAEGNWREWFYGLQSWDEAHLGPGYWWAETIGGDVSGEDSSLGWDATLLQVIPPANAPAEERARLLRLGLGTALLGDGFFGYTFDQVGFNWQAEYEWDFGAPAGDYFRELHWPEGEQNPPDTLYVRIFERGFVEINPDSAAVVLGIPGVDGRLVLWPTASEVVAEAIGPHQVRVRFTAPGPGMVSPPASEYGYELRYCKIPFDASSWGTATPYGGNPIVAPPGSPRSVSVGGLDSGATYHFGLRSVIDSRLESRISEVVTATTWTGESIGGEEHDEEVPDENEPPAGVSIALRLRNPYPAGGDIRLRCPAGVPVEAAIHGVLGERVRSLAPVSAGGGEVLFRWDGRTDGGERAGSGIYYLRMRAGAERIRRTFVLVE